MSQPQRSQYLESKVLTAPSHRLHLMLIEGGIRYGKEAQAALCRGDELAADVPVMRLLDIVSEMLVGIRQTKTELNLKIAELYLYLFRLVGEAKVNSNPDKLAEALRLLEFERQTWQLVCDKLASDPAASAPVAPTAAASAPRTVPIAPLAGGPSPVASPGISLEA